MKIGGAKENWRKIFDQSPLLRGVNEKGKLYRPSSDPRPKAKVFIPPNSEDPSASDYLLLSVIADDSRGIGRRYLYREPSGPAACGVARLTRDQLAKISAMVDGRFPEARWDGNPHCLHGNVDYVGMTEGEIATVASLFAQECEYVPSSALRPVAGGDEEG